MNNNGDAVPGSQACERDRALGDFLGLRMAFSARSSAESEYNSNGLGMQRQIGLLELGAIHPTTVVLGI